jgi:hypothetical protein
MKITPLSFTLTKFGTREAITIIVGIIVDVLNIIVGIIVVGHIVIGYHVVKITV